jgi:hypothetical protein
MDASQGPVITMPIGTIMSDINVVTVTVTVLHCIFVYVQIVAWTQSLVFVHLLVFSLFSIS